MAFDVSSIGQPLDDRYPEDIAVDAVAQLQELLPDWVARNASPEIIYLEAVALAVADVVATGNSAIGAVTEAILSTLYDVPRYSGSVATATLTLSFDSAVSLTVPAGTTFVMPDYGVELATTVAATVSSASSVSLTAATTTATSELNGVSSATIDLIDYIPNALSVTISAAFSGGADPEDDITYIERARNRLARVTNSLVVADHFTAYALESPLVSNATTINSWDGTGTAPNAGSAGTDAGEVTVAVYGIGAQVSAGNKATLAGEMQDITAAGVTVNVKDAVLVDIDVTCTVLAKPGENTSVVQTQVQNALTAFLNPETWPFGETVTRDDIRAVILATDGVDSISAMSVPSTGSPDTTLKSNEVASADDLTITVNSS